MTEHASIETLDALTAIRRARADGQDPMEAASAMVVTGTAVFVYLGGPDAAAETLETMVARVRSGEFLTTGAAGNA